MSESIENTGPFEAQLQDIEEILDQLFRPRYGANIRTNIERLRHLQTLNKSLLEAFLSHAFLISLNDDEYSRLHGKICDLLSENEQTFREMGCDPSSVL